MREVRGTPTGVKPSGKGRAWRLRRQSPLPLWERVRERENRHDFTLPLPPPIEGGEI